MPTCSSGRVILMPDMLFLTGLPGDIDMHVGLETQAGGGDGQPHIY
jgi:hypothetical protein